MIHHEPKSRTHHLVPGRAGHVGQMGPWEKPSPAAGPTCTNHPDGRRRNIQPGYCTQDEDLSSYGAAVAGTLLGAPTARPAKGCASFGSDSQDQREEDPSSCRSNPADDSAPCDPLEHAQYGQSTTS